MLESGASRLEEATNAPPAQKQTHAIILQTHAENQTRFLGSFRDW